MTLTDKILSQLCGHGLDEAEFLEAIEDMLDAAQAAPDARQDTPHLAPPRREHFRLSDHRRTTCITK